MRRRLATLAAASALVLTLGMGASPALAGSPAFHVSIPATASDPVVCGSHIYAPVSGTFEATAHFGSSASGNFNSADTLVARNIVVEDRSLEDLPRYSVVGAERFGDTFNGRTGDFQRLLVIRLQVVGTGDSLSLVMRWSPNGDFSSFGPGTCSP